MNLFLLFAVPLAAVALHRYLFAEKNPFIDVRQWIWGGVWSLIAVVAASFFGKWREFSGHLGATFAGLVVSDAVLVPSVVVAAWLWLRPRTDAWELSLWLTLVFSMAGIRDFVSWSRTDDLNQLFLIPLSRVLVLVWLPWMLRQAEDTLPVQRWLWWTAAGALVVSGPLFQVLSYAHWGWIVWILAPLGIATGVWTQKKPPHTGAVSTNS